MWYAGWDASGTPNLNGMENKHDPYVSVVAGVQNVEGFAQGIRTLRTEWGMKADAECHAHNMPEEQHTAFLKVASENKLVVGAILVDKSATRRIRDVLDLPAPATLQVLAALSILEEFIARHTLIELRFDEDIQGKKRQQEFITAVKRLHRSAWPTARLKVQPLPSHKSDLIQLADIVAYVLGKWARNSIQTAELSNLVAVMRNDPNNIIQGPKAWDK